MTQREITLAIAGGGGALALLILHRRAKSAASSTGISAPGAVAGGTLPAQGPLSTTLPSGRPGSSPMPTPNPEPHLWQLNDGTTAIVAGTGSTPADVTALDAYGLPVITAASS